MLVPMRPSRPAGHGRRPRPAAAPAGDHALDPQPARKRHAPRRAHRAARQAPRALGQDPDRRRRPGHPLGVARGRVQALLPARCLAQPDDRRRRPWPDHRARRRARAWRRHLARGLAARRPARADQAAGVRSRPPGRLRTASRHWARRARQARRRPEPERPSRRSSDRSGRACLPVEIARAVDLAKFCQDA